MIRQHLEAVSVCTGVRYFLNQRPRTFEADRGLVMAWILIRTFLITPLVLIMAALILLTLGLQSLYGEMRPSVEHTRNG